MLESRLITKVDRLASMRLRNDSGKKEKSSSLFSELAGRMSYVIRGYIFSLVSFLDIASFFPIYLFLYRGHVIASSV